MLSTCQSQLCEYQEALIPLQLFQTRSRDTPTLLIKTKVVAGTRNACQSILFWITTIGTTRTFTQLPNPLNRQLCPQESTPRQPLYSIKVKGQQERCPRGSRNRGKVPPWSHRGLQIGNVELLKADIGVLVDEIMRNSRD